MRCHGITAGAAKGAWSRLLWQAVPGFLVARWPGGWERILKLGPMRRESEADRAFGCGFQFRPGDHLPSHQPTVGLAQNPRASRLDLILRFCRATENSRA